MDVVVPGSGVAFDPLVIAVAVLNFINKDNLLINLSPSLNYTFSLKFITGLVISA